MARIISIINTKSKYKFVGMVKITTKVELT